MRIETYATSSFNAWMMQCGPNFSHKTSHRELYHGDRGQFTQRVDVYSVNGAKLMTTNDGKTFTVPSAGDLAKVSELIRRWERYSGHDVTVRRPKECGQ